MKKFLVTALIAVTALTTVACGSSNTEAEANHVNGTYRGAYLDGSVEVELSLKDDVVEGIKFKKLKYKDTDFLAKDSSETSKLLAGQYTSLIDYLVGKNISELDALYTPGEIVETIDGLASASSKEGEVVDTLSGATVRSGKVISAINDALNRGAYKLAE